jgi:twitching motility protein PilT
MGGRYVLWDMDQTQFLGLLKAAVQYKASDVHLHPGMPPGLRVKGDVINVKFPPLTDADFKVILGVLFSGKHAGVNAADLKEYDGSFEVQGLCRFRFNVFRYKGKLAAILRIISSEIPTIESLNMPPVLTKIASYSRGLVLVTGATGSGKSTTLAAMLDYINANFPYHILTIEDPIEYVHPTKKARVSQREVGADTGNFVDALRAALRQDPDVILVGEMRDKETIDIALKAAETGHLVFATVHTNDAIRTIGRLVAVFRPDEQDMVRQRLADNLVATISQRLVKRKDGNGVVAAQEIMISNAGIAECISDKDRTHEINDFIMKSKELTGAQTFDYHLARLYRDDVIDLATAKEAATNASDFERNLMYGDKTTVRPPSQRGERQEHEPEEGKITLDNSDSSGDDKSVA